MAGHRLLSKRINDYIRKHIIDTQQVLTTDDLSVLITHFFDELNPIEKDIFPLSFSCAYGGVDGKNKASLIFGSYNNTNKKYEYRKVTHYDIFSPTDANAKHCYGTLMLNCVQMKKDYPEIILHDIATKSNLVSSCGDMWVFDISTQKGALTKIQGKAKGESNNGNTNL